VEGKMFEQNDQQFQQDLQRIEQLIVETEQTTDPIVREKTKELVQTLLNLHAAGLARIIEIVSRSGEPGQAIVNGLALDEVVKPLLVLYGLHPASFEERVRQAVEKVRPSLGVHGATVEILSIEEERVKLQVSRNGNGNANGHGSSSEALKQALEEAIQEAAPDYAGLEVLGLEAEAAAGWSGFIPLAQVKGIRTHKPEQENVGRVA
jgi:Fe-S cluster biogenesis protein NfuA